MTLLGVSLQTHDLEVIVPNNWVPPDAQPQVQAEPVFLTLYISPLPHPTGPWMSSHLGLCFFQISVAGIWGACGPWTARTVSVTLP